MVSRQLREPPGGIGQRTALNSLHEKRSEQMPEILGETGTPAEAGPEFGAHAQRVRSRLALGDVPEDGRGFVESPDALVYWAPIVDDLKELDAEIVRNSVRFRWHEVQRDLSHNLDPAAIMASAAP